MMSAEKLWWERVPNAARLVRSTCEKLRVDRHSVQLLPDMPWKESFLEEVYDRLRDEDAGIAHHRFDGAAMRPGVPLLDNIAEELGLHYDYDGMLNSLLCQLQTSSLYIWRMCALSPGQLQEAQQLARELYRAHAHVVIVLEDDAQASVKWLYKVALNISPVDLHYFAWTLLLERGNVRLPEYAALLCEGLSRGDPLCCARLCGEIDALLEDAAGVCTHLPPGEVQQLVYMAQLRGIQPIIEEERLKFIDSLGDRIREILPFEDEYGGEYTEPREVELRHLMHYQSELDLTREEYRLLKKLYDARNDLAHLRPLTQDTLLALAELSGRQTGGT